MLGILQTLVFLFKKIYSRDNPMEAKVHKMSTDSLIGIDRRIAYS